MKGSKNIMILQEKLANSVEIVNLFIFENTMKLLNAFPFSEFQ